MSCSKNENRVKLTVTVMEAEKVPMMQIVTMKINGVEYELFGPIISDEQLNIGELQEITFSDHVPMTSVLVYLSSMLANSDLDSRKKMQ